MRPVTKQIMHRLRALGDDQIAAHAKRFFKTGKGEYGEGDRFLGIRVPLIRKCVREYRGISLDDTLELLQSPFHEARQLALLILVAKYAAAATDSAAAQIYRSYRRHTPHINNWDLVDCSAEHIVGAHLLFRNRSPIHKLASSRSLWERRIAVMATFHFIKRNDFADTFVIAERLLHDREDLIHKAVGWMLREIGKRDRESEEAFLMQHYRTMPRTMLRYAIEKFAPDERRAFLRGEK
jgi:3-methyladenine DNA glycosylase AlkD